MQEKFNNKFKDYEFPFDTLMEKFGAMKEEKQMEFCKQISEAMENGAIKKLFDDVIRRFYKEIACQVENMEQLNLNRNSMLVFDTLTGLVDYFVNFRAEHLSKRKTPIDKI